MKMVQLAVERPQCNVAGPMDQQRQEELGAAPGSEGAGWLASGLAGAAGRAWSYITDEASALDAATAPPPPTPRVAVALKLHLTLLGTLSPCL